MSAVEADQPVQVGGIVVTPFRSIDSAVDHALPGGGTVQPGSWVAINAEKVMRAKSDPSVMRLLQQATVRYPDGMAVVWTMRQKGRLTERIPGVELWEALMTRAARDEIGVYLIGARPEVLDSVGRRLTDERSVRLAGARHGYDLDESALIESVAASGARIVTVALGSPGQERFIERCRVACPDALFMGVGGTYDVFAGVAGRAPRWMGRAGLEWFYRLLRQPSRITRQAVYARYMCAHLTRRL